MAAAPTTESLTTDSTVTYAGNQAVHVLKLLRAEVQMFEKEFGKAKEVSTARLATCIKDKIILYYTDYQYIILNGLDAEDWRREPGRLGKKSIPLDKAVALVNDSRMQGAERFCLRQD